MNYFGLDGIVCQVAESYKKIDSKEQRSIQYLLYIAEQRVGGPEISSENSNFTNLPTYLRSPNVAICGLSICDVKKFDFPPLCLCALTVTQLSSSFTHWLRPRDPHNPPAFELVYEGAIGQQRQTTSF